MVWTTGSAYIFFLRARRKYVLMIFCYVSIVESCDPGSFYKNGKCNPCPVNCESCLSSDECKECKLGYFGKTCFEECSFCKDRLCNKNTGHCVTSCKDGYYFSANLSCTKCPGNCKECISERHCSKCEAGYMNILCQNFCENCEPGTSCDQTSGYCSGACKAGLSGTFCNTSCVSGCASCERQHKDQCIDCTTGRYGIHCEMQCSETCRDKECNKIDGSCTYGCTETFYGLTCKNKISDTNYQQLHVILGTSVGILLFIIAVMLIVLKRRKFGLARKDPDIEQDTLQTLTSKQDEQQHNDSDNTLQHNTKLATKNHREDIRRCVAEKPEAKFSAEFKNLPQNDDTGTLRQSRITSDTNAKDYICARRIAAYTDRREYIVCKDPSYMSVKVKTTFWNLVWEARCKLIVGLIRKSEPRSREYLPRVPKSYGGIRVKVSPVQKLDSSDSSEIELNKLGEERTIEHLLFYGFPTDGLPRDAKSLTEFSFMVRQKTSNLPGPLLVLCSDGVTLSGLYVCLDMLMAETEIRDSVKISECVEYLKKQTGGMIKSVEEYTKFLHKAFACWCTHSLLTTSTTNEAVKK